MDDKKKQAKFEMEAMLRAFEMSMFDRLSEIHGVDIPPETHELIKCLVLSGCPMKCVLEGFCRFGEAMESMNEKAMSEREALKELLKDIPIQWEDD